jgi:uncharacterized protein YegL
MKKQQSVISKISNKTPAKKKTIVNNIEIVFDASGSMGVIRQKALDAVNQQIEAIRTNSLNSGQVVNLGITFFNGLGSNRMSFDASNIRTINFSEYIPDGGTPLWDAVGRAMDQAPSANRNEDTSYMVIVVTDGEENESRTYNQTNLGEKIKKAIASDIWTFAFSVPAYGVTSIKRLNIPDGCIQTWDGTAASMNIVAKANTAVIGNYYATRSAGGTSLQNCYLDLSKVTKKDISALNKVTDRYHRFSVSEEKDISTFVNAKLTSNTLARALGSSYVQGRGFYQLSKPEKVHDYKQIIIEDVKTGELYTGSREDINNILGLADNDCKVTPLVGGKYTIYIQSTSSNRKLVRGTNLLYQKT